MPVVTNTSPLVDYIDGREAYYCPSMSVEGASSDNRKPATHSGD
jgi:hypothetical protein